MSAALKYGIDRLRADLHYQQRQVAVAVSSDAATALDEAQHRADAVLGLWNEKASAPVTGELPGEYRRRLLAQMKARAPNFKDRNLATVPAEMLEIVEEKVRHDVRAAAYDPSTVPPGQMRQVRERDELGRMITRYVGNDPVWMDTFSGTHAVGKVNAKLAGVA